MNCKGKCQLSLQYKKVVSENASDKNQQSTLKISGIEQFVVIENEPIQTNEIIQPNTDRKISFYANFYYFNYQNTAIKPPNNFVC